MEFHGRILLFFNTRSRMLCIPGVPFLVTLALRANKNSAQSSMHLDSEFYSA